MENIKLIKQPMSNRPSDLTTATNDDLMSNKDNSSILRGDDLFSARSLKSSTLETDDDEKAKTASPTKFSSIPTPTGAAPSGPKTMRINTGRTSLKPEPV